MTAKLNISRLSTASLGKFTEKLVRILICFNKTFETVAGVEMVENGSTRVVPDHYMYFSVSLLLFFMQSLVHGHVPKHLNQSTTFRICFLERIVGLIYRSTSVVSQIYV